MQSSSRCRGLSHGHSKSSAYISRVRQSRRAPAQHDASVPGAASWHLASTRQSRRFTEFHIIWRCLSRQGKPRSRTFLQSRLSAELYMGASRMWRISCACNCVVDGCKHRTSAGPLMQRTDESPNVPYAVKRHCCVSQQLTATPAMSSASCACESAVCTSRQPSGPRQGIPVVLCHAHAGSLC